MPRTRANIILMFSLLPLLNCVGCQVTLKKVSEQLLKEGEAVSRLQAELKKEQGVVKSLKSKLTKVRIFWLQSDKCKHNKDRGYFTCVQLNGSLWQSEFELDVLI